MRVTVGELVEATGGTLVRGDPEARVASYGIDTRTLGRDGVFFALGGSRTDGHAFLDAAARAGAVAAVVSREPGAGGELPPALIRVDDTTVALGRCGSLARRKLNGAQVIGLTGSTGKTTTKELIAAGIAARRKVHKTPGNLNNHLGVPLTLLASPEDAEVLVVEIGMSGHGEVAALTRMVRPDIGLVTNIRPAHMEAFRTLDDVAAAKGEMFAMLDERATSVVNVDDPHVRVQAMRHAGPRVTFGRRESDVRLEGVEDRFVPGARLAVRLANAHYRLQLRLGGAHSAANAVAALAVIVASGHDIPAAVDAMQRVEPGPGRGRIIRLDRDVTLIDDSYNSNPAALAAVLETLRGTPCNGRKILVMGEMLELGKHEGTFHNEAGKRAAGAGVKLMIGVGRRTRVALESARRSGVPEVHFEPDGVSAARFVAGRLGPGDVVLVKGSRSVRLELLVRALIDGRGSESG